MNEREPSAEAVRTEAVGVYEKYIQEFGRVVENGTDGLATDSAYQEAKAAKDRAVHTYAEVAGISDKEALDEISERAGINKAEPLALGARLGGKTDAEKELRARLWEEAAK